MKSSLFFLLVLIAASPCVASLPPVNITTVSLPAGIADSTYSAVINATGGCTPYKWAIASGKLPTGVTQKVSSSTTSLTLTGTPTIPATYAFTVSVTGCGGYVDTAALKIVVNDPGATITTASLPNGTVSTAYSAAVDATGGGTPYKWAITSGKLPAGVTQKVSSNTTALDLAGTPTTAGSYAFTVSVTGSGGHVDTASFKVTIQSSAKNVVDLSWKGSTSTDVAGYNVYRSPNGSTWSKLNASLIASTLYSDSTVAANTTYYYAATTVDIHGRESVKTPSVKAVIP
jgi:Putative Ig domain